MKKPRIFVYVEGGVVHAIVTDTEVDIRILDTDVDGIAKPTTYSDMKGIKFKAVVCDSRYIVDKEIVDHYFKQIKNKKK